MKSLPTCKPGDHVHPQPGTPVFPAEARDRAARLFRALGDGPRLQILEMLAAGESCVTEIVERFEEKFSTVSQRLRILRTEGLVARRRKGTHLFYALADRHVADLIRNALEHAAELEGTPASASPPEDATTPKKGDRNMKASHPVHADHDHQHGPGCGHTGVKHNGHVDYLHDGHLHHVGNQGVEEHKLEVTDKNPAACTPDHNCGGHPAGHQHGPTCGHEAVPHGEHVDYLVNGHLHHPHGKHCDDHGRVHSA